jgi:hypothetical protein
MRGLQDPSGTFPSDWNPKIFERLRPSWEYPGRNNTTPTNSVYGAMQDGYVERFDQKISPRPSFPKRGITISPFGKGGIRGIL